MKVIFATGALGEQFFQKSYLHTKTREQKHLFVTDKHDRVGTGTGIYNRGWDWKFTEKCKYTIISHSDKFKEFSQNPVSDTEVALNGTSTI